MTRGLILRAILWFALTLALIRQVRSPQKASPWKQPTDQFDAYQLVNPFTGKPDECTENGKTYATKIANNVWSPSGYPAGWQEVTK